MDGIAHFAIEALALTLLLSAPALGAAFAVGLVSGLLQTATQLQDATLSFVPRLLAVAGALVLGGAWMGAQLLEFTRQLWTNLAL
jgi:type III secretion HrpO family protein